MKSYKIIFDENGKDAARIVSKRLLDRGCREEENAELTLCLSIDGNMREDSFRLEGGNEHITVFADSGISLLGGCGYLLHNSNFGKNGITPTTARGSFHPESPARCVYTATHFHTYYWTAPLDELLVYVEDLTLMGINEFCQPLPWNNLGGASEEEMQAAYERVATVLKYAKRLGMRLLNGISVGCVPDAPKELLATPIPDEMHKRGNAGVKVCPSKPQGQKFIDDYNRSLLKRFSELGVSFDIFSTFPYDEGGCGCPECDPWGAKGYIRAAKSALKVAKETNPNARLNVSTWLFDFPDKGEWKALYKSLWEEPWAVSVEADSHDAFPRFPLENDLPEGIVLRSFPEITMWGLWPWGGYGAHFFPKRYTEIFRSTKGKLSGGRMYSEGIFEDLNKYTVASLFFDKNAEPKDTVKKYGTYYFGAENGDALWELVDCIETNMVRCARSDRTVISMTEETNRSDPRLAKRALHLAQEIDASLPDWGKKSFRWRLIYLRAVIDYYRYQNVVLHECAPVVEAMEEVARIYYCLKNYKIADDPFHMKLRPPLPIDDPDFKVEDYPNIGSLHIAYETGLIRTGREPAHSNKTVLGPSTQA